MVVYTRLFIFFNHNLFLRKTFLKHDFAIGGNIFLGGFTKDFAKATVITTVIAAAGIGNAAALSEAALPAAAAVGIGVVTGAVLSIAEDAWKRKWIGYT